MDKALLVVKKYETRFRELFRHDITIVLDEAQRAHRFMRGLNFTILSYVFRVSKKRLPSGPLRVPTRRPS